MTTRVKSLRRAKGLSQEELAAAAGLRGAASISDIENGKANPTLSTLQAIAIALDAHVLDLFEDDRLDPPARDLYELLRALPPDQQAALVKLLLPDPVSR